MKVNANDLLEAASRIGQHIEAGLIAAALIIGCFLLWAALLRR